MVVRNQKSLCYAIAMRIYRTYLYTFLLILIPFVSHAQFTPGTTAPTIKSSSSHPDAYTEVTLSLDAYTLDTNGSKISWTVDGINQPKAENERSLKVMTGAIGSIKEVRATLTLPNGSIVHTPYRLTATRVDLIIESDSFVPTFYKGRALPSTGSMVRAIALPTDGSGKSANQFSYVWRLNNKTLQGGSIYGKNTMMFEMPLGSEQILSVSIVDNLGRTTMKKTIALNPTDAELHFYIENPLKGLSRTVLTSPYLMLEDEVRIHAEPYYVSRSLLTNENLVEWRIDGKKVDNPSEDFGTIVLERSGVGGASTIGFHMRDLTNFLSGISGSFQLQL